jgi:ubiquinone/menaquinone biosynthesis C-methylase UbiE
MATGTSTLFDRWSATYDRPRFQDATYRPVHDAVLARLDGIDPERIVDLGCGTGHLTARLAQHFVDADVVGIDYSAGMLAKAAGRLGGKARLLQADAQQLPVRPNSIDVVTCTESFHWYPDQVSALSEIANGLRPNGRLIIASIAAFTEFGDAAIHTVSTMGGQPVRAATARRLHSLLASSGFTVLHQRRIPRMGLVPWPVLTDARLG